MSSFHMIPSSVIIIDQASTQYESNLKEGIHIKIASCKPEAEKT